MYSDLDLMVIEFSSNDRCDRCGMQAFSLAEREDMPAELLFCIHHMREVYDRLLEDGWSVIHDNAGMEMLADHELVYA